MTKPILIVLQGISRSGKSTFADELKKKGNYEVAHPDGERFKLLRSDETKIYYDPKAEKQVRDIVFDKFDKAIRKPKNIIFDATNLIWGKRYPIIARARKFGYKIIFYVFDIPLWICLERDRKLQELGLRFVGEKIIAGQFYSFKFPSYWEYDECKIVTLENGKLVIRDKSKY